MTHLPELTENTPKLWQPDYPVPQADGHKYHRGSTIVLSGGPTRTGAARLAAQAALRAGSGLVTVYSPPNAVAVNAAHLTAVMLKSIKGSAQLSKALSDDRITSVVLGPALGVGEKTRGKVKTVLASNLASNLASHKECVLDADALTSFAKNPASLFKAIKETNAPVVLTPHMGEFCALFGGETTNDPNQRATRALGAAKLSGAIVVLKGAETLIAQSVPDTLCINHNAPPWLATAGSGDVLAGIIGGLLAQGMPAFKAACAGVWLHAEAGNVCGPGLTAQDLDCGLREVVGKIIKNISK